jgi:hypothetical protein
VAFEPFSLAIRRFPSATSLARVDNSLLILRECKDLRSGISIEQLAEQYRGSLRDALRWIISPTTFSDAELAAEAMALAAYGAKFLQEHARGLHTQFNPSVIIDKKAKLSIRLLRRFSNVDSVIAGLCLFILDQIDRHDLGGEPLTEVFPFSLCGRPDCGRLFIVQRVGRARFCSNKCRSAAGKRKKTSEEKAAYMRGYRALKATRAAKTKNVAKHGPQGKG